MTTHSLILGSSSPRRKEILSSFKLPFKCHSPDFDEDSVIFKGCPEKYVKEIALGKAKSLKKTFPKGFFITSDTTVYYRGRVFPKPLDNEQAIDFLTTLSGKWHHVYSAISCFNGKSFHTYCEKSRVQFHSLSSKQIEYYTNTFNCLDKAGAYMIQLPGAMIVKKIDGCFYNVMGLPLAALEKALNKGKLSLWSV